MFVGALTKGLESFADFVLLCNMTFTDIVEIWYKLIHK